MKKIMTIIALSLSALSLSACNTGSKLNAQSRVPTTAASDYATTAKAYALPGEPGYRGSDYAFFKNPLRAPANQTYYFSFASSKMRPDDLHALQVQANFLASHPSAKVRLEGNTDNRGSREYNVGLGWRRDQSIARLLEEQGVRPSQIQMVSYGKEHPVVDENNERAWALNRRVNLVYKAKS